MMSITNSEEHFAHEQSYKRASILWSIIGATMIALVAYGAIDVAVRDNATEQHDVTQLAALGDINQLTAPRDWE